MSLDLEKAVKYNWFTPNEDMLSELESVSEKNKVAWAIANALNAEFNGYKPICRGKKLMGLAWRNKEDIPLGWKSLGEHHISGLWVFVAIPKRNSKAGKALFERFDSVRFYNMTDFSQLYGGVEMCEASLNGGFILRGPIIDSVNGKQYFGVPRTYTNKDTLALCKTLQAHPLSIIVSEIEAQTTKETPS